MPDPSELPLAGLTVLDFSTLLPGPLAGLILAEAGAQVIKIERPGGEEMRLYPPHKAGLSALYTILNADKDVVELDLKTEAGQTEARRLAKTADILIEQFRPGVMTRLGLGYDELSRLNPRLVYCAITGYGQSGPKAGAAGHDLNYIGDTGLLALQPGAPNVPPALIADIGGGTFPAIINILLALLKRERTGQGAILDIAMTDAMFTFAWWAYAEGRATGIWSGPGDGTLAGGSPRYGLYPTADGALVAVAALEEKFWAACCDVTLLSAQDRDDRSDPARARTALAAAIRAKPAAQWEPLFEKADCCVTIVRSLEDAIRHPHFKMRGLFEGDIDLGAGETLDVLPLPLVHSFRKRGMRRAPTR